MRKRFNPLCKRTIELKWSLRIVDTSKLQISCRVKFENDRGAKFHSNVYEVSDGWGRKRDIFTIQPNSTITLAIARRKHEDLSLYPRSRSFAGWSLDGETYDISLIFRMEVNKDEIWLQGRHTILQV